MQSERRLLESRINRFVGLVSTLSDDELRAELAKHLCVLSSGLLEISCKDILNRYASKRCSPEIQRFVASHLADFYNAKIAKIYELLGCFDSTLATHWRDDLSDEEADAVDSIVNNKNQIAHGRSVGLSFSVWKNYYDNALNAVRTIEKHFPPY